MTPPHEAPPALLLTADSQAGRVCQEVLRQLGFAPDWVQDGRQALAHIRQAAPALIILDLQLPGVSGIELMAPLRAAAAPLVILTPDVICMHLTGVPVEAELLKPVLRDDLLAALRRVLAAPD